MCFLFVINPVLKRDSSNSSPRLQPMKLPRVLWLSGTKLESGRRELDIVMNISR